MTMVATSVQVAVAVYERVRSQFTHWCTSHSESLCEETFKTPVLKNCFGPRVLMKSIHDHLLMSLNEYMVCISPS